MEWQRDFEHCSFACIVHIIYFTYLHWHLLHWPGRHCLLFMITAVDDHAQISIDCREGCGFVSLIRKGFMNWIQTSESWRDHLEELGWLFNRLNHPDGKTFPLGLRLATPTWIVSQAPPNSSFWNCILVNPTTPIACGCHRLWPMTCGPLGASIWTRCWSKSKPKYFWPRTYEKNHKNN